jgi:SAM-dependent methyltransferase
MGLDRRTRALLRLYRDEPVAVRAHSLARVASCPLAGLERQVPRAGRILEVGAGRGLVTNYLALAGPERELAGIEPDQERVALANRCRARPGVSFTVGSAADPLPGGLDAVLVVDVLYLLPAAAHDDLVARAAAALRPGGLLLLKEMATEPGWKLALARWQEELVVHGLGWTRGEGAFTFRPPAELARVMAASGLVPRIHRLDRWALHPHALVVGEKRR